MAWLLLGPLEESMWPRLGLCVVPHASVAALAEDGVLSFDLRVWTIRPEDVLSLPPARNVFNMPPRFSGLGVLEPERGCSTCAGGDRVDCCSAASVRLCVLGMLFDELFLLVNEGRDGAALAGLVGSDGGRDRSG